MHYTVIILPHGDCMQDAFSKKQIQKQVLDPRHPMDAWIYPTTLKFRKSFASDNPLTQILLWKATE